MQTETNKKQVRVRPKLAVVNICAMLCGICVALFSVLSLFSVLCRVSRRMGRRWGAHSLGVLRPCPLLLGWQKRWAGSLEIRSDRLLLCCWDKILELKWNKKKFSF